MCIAYNELIVITYEFLGSLEHSLYRVFTTGYIFAYAQSIGKNSAGVSYSILVQFGPTQSIFLQKKKNKNGSPGFDGHMTSVRNPISMQDLEWELECQCDELGIEIWSIECRGRISGLDSWIGILFHEGLYCGMGI